MKGNKPAKEANPDYVRFGSFLRARREAAGLSLRGVASKLGIQPAYLSQVELGNVGVSENVSKQLAELLGEDPDVLYAMAGKVSSDLLAIIAKRPKAFAELIRHLKSAPDHAILRVVREVRDGEW